MAQPTPYTPNYDFSDYQAVNPDQPLPADELDIELHAIETTLDGLCTNIELIQRDDGKLRNASVSTDTLGADVLALIAASATSASSDMVTPTGGTTALPFAQQLQGALTPMNFGAVGDKLADDGAVLEAAFTYSADTGIPIVIDRPYKTKRGLFLNKYAKIICIGQAELYADMSSGKFSVLSVNNYHYVGGINGYLKIESDSASNRTDPLSKALRLGQASGTDAGRADGNMGCRIDYVEIGQGFYDGVYSNQELDASRIIGIRMTKPVGRGCIYLKEESSVCVAPSAGLTIESYHLSCGGVPGDTKYGIFVSGSDSVHIGHGICNNADIAYCIENTTGLGRNQSPELSNVYSEDTRKWVLRQPPWVALQSGTSGETIVVPVLANGYYYTASTTGTAGAAEPTWPTVIGNTVIDGTITWTCTGLHAGRWRTGATVAAGRIVRPNKPYATGWMYVAGGAGTTGATEPDWSTAVTDGATVTDNGITWTATYQSKFVKFVGASSLANLKVSNPHSFGHICQYEQASGSSRLHIDNANYLNQSNRNSDLSYYFSGTTAHGNVVITSSHLQGDFRPWVKDHTSTYHARAIVNHTLIEDESIGVVNGFSLAWSHGIRPAVVAMETESSIAAAGGVEVVRLFPGAEGTFSKEGQRILVIHVRNATTSARYMLMVPMLITREAGDASVVFGTPFGETGTANALKMADTGGSIANVQALPSVWTGTTAYVQYRMARPTTPNGYVYIATTAGTSGAGEPTWPTTVGGTVVDGTVTWTCKAALAAIPSDARYMEFVVVNVHATQIIDCTLEIK